MKCFSCLYILSHFPSLPFLPGFYHFINNLHSDPDSVFFQSFSPFINSAGLISSKLYYYPVSFLFESFFMVPHCLFRVGEKKKRIITFRPSINWHEITFLVSSTTVTYNTLHSCPTDSFLGFQTNFVSSHIKALANNIICLEDASCSILCILLKF